MYQNKINFILSPVFLYSLLILVLLTLILLYFELKSLIKFFEKFFKFYFNFLIFLIFLLVISFLYSSFGLKNFIFLLYFIILFISFVLICKNLNINNKFIYFFKKKNYFLYFQKVMLIKFLFLYLYVLSGYSICENSLTKYMQNSIDSDVCVLIAGALLFTCTVSYVSIKTYQYFELSKQDKVAKTINQLNDVRNLKISNHLEYINASLIKLDDIEQQIITKQPFEQIKFELESVRETLKFTSESIKNSIKEIKKINLDTNRNIMYYQDSFGQSFSSISRRLNKNNQYMEVLFKRLKDLETKVNMSRIEKLSLISSTEAPDIINKESLQINNELVNRVNELESQVEMFEKKLDLKIKSNKSSEVHDLNVYLKSLLFNTESPREVELIARLKSQNIDMELITDPVHTIKFGYMKLSFESVLLLIVYLLDKLEEDSISYSVALYIIKFITHFDINADPLLLDDELNLDHTFKSEVNPINFEIDEKKEFSSEESKKRFIDESNDLLYVVKFFLNTRAFLNKNNNEEDV